MVGIILVLACLIGIILSIRKITKINREKMAKEIEDSL
jgi:hypothetical protein